jgi:hypothetical protein
MLLRRPPIVAPAELVGQAELTFGFATVSEPEGWMVSAYGPDGRRLGRPLKGLSESAQVTLIRMLSLASSPSDLQRLSDAWTTACREGHTNADVLTAFSDAAIPMGG